MLYDWLETQRALMRSVDRWAASLALSCGLPAPRREAFSVPGCEWVRRVFQTTPEPPPFAIASVTIGGRRVAIEETVVDAVAFCSLRRFARHCADGARLGVGRGAGAPILLCSPLAGHHAVMMRETVETLLEDADVYVTDWADARDVPLSDGRFSLDEYVLTVERFMRLLCGDGLHVLAVCQATAPAVAAAALVAARGEPAPISVTLMGGPIDTRLSPTGVDRLAVRHSIDWFRDTVIDTVPAWYRGAGRRIYPGYLQHAAIVAAHPHRQLALEARYWSSRLSGDESTIAASRRVLDEYSAVLDMTEDYFLDTLQIVFKEQRLARGVWEVDGQRICARALESTALCTVEGSCDDITGAGQTHAAHAVCSAVPNAMRKRLTIPDCDHYDLFTGSRWRDAIHPALAAFWRETRKPQRRQLNLNHA